MIVHAENSSDELWRSFSEALGSDGRIVFPPLPEEDPSPPSDSLLESLENTRRLGFLGTPPEFNAKAAGWAALTVFHAARNIAERHREVRDFDQWLQSEFAPTSESPSSIYSVDLFLSCLPDLFTLAKRKSEEDPLLDSLRKLSRSFPFSDPASPDLDPGTLADSPVFSHPSLLGTFTDRVIARSAWNWLVIPEVRNRAREVVGAHPDHFQQLNDQLLTHESSI